MRILSQTGFGVSFLRSYFSRIRFASEKVDLSQYVIPEAITERSSPTTSDITRETAWQARFSISLPPFTCERCFLTQFISLMLAPDFMSDVFIRCLSPREIPSGKETRDEVPPDIKNMTSAVGSRPFRNCSILWAAKTLFLVGTGWPARITVTLFELISDAMPSGITTIPDRMRVRSFTTFAIRSADLPIDTTFTLEYLSSSRFLPFNLRRFPLNISEMASLGRDFLRPCSSMESVSFFSRLVANSS